VKRKSSARGEVAKNVVAPAAVGLGIAAAADRIGPLVHHAADKVGPLAQSAADKVGPLAQSAADRIGPIAQSAADRIAPVAGRVSPFATHAVGYVSPYAHQAVGYVTPIAYLAAARVTPLAESAKLHGIQFAHGAAGAVGPRLEDAWGRVMPVVDAATHRVSDDLMPRVSGALAAAAGSPIAVEASRRSRATLAAARGELVLPADEPTRGGSWVKRIAVVAAVGGLAALAVKQLLGSKDDQWQARRAPTFPRPTTTQTSTPSAADSSTGTPEPLNWAVATGQADPTEQLDEKSEQTIVEHVGEPSDRPAEAAPEATVAEKLPDSDMPMSEAPRTPDASETNMPETEGTRTTPDARRT
jgi:hypothetical protein